MIKDKLPGLRTIKTALSVSLCAILFEIFDWIFDLSNLNYFYSAIASVFTVQQKMEDSINLGIQRIWGTLVGGGVSLLAGSLYVYVFNEHYEILFLFLSIILTIHIIYKLQLNGSIPTACIVIISTFAIKTDVFIAFVFLRTIETVIGVIIGLLVNKFIFPYNPAIEIEN